MDRQQHWESIYKTKSVTEVSWFEATPQVSLELIHSVATLRSRIIDVGGGASRLVDCLLQEHFESVTVLDLSSAALDLVKHRLGELADRVEWIVADVTQVESLGHFDVWHDRAVFHFLTEAADRRRYVDLLRRSLSPGGHLIIGTFGPDGPLKCSNLEICRYDAASLKQELGPGFQLVREFPYTHITPSGKDQKFTFCLFRRETTETSPPIPE